MTMEMQLILAKLDAITASLSALAGKVEDIKVNMGLNATVTQDTLKKVIHDEVTASATVAKEKKKVAAGEAKAGEEKKVAAKKTHPSLPDVTEAAWGLKKSGDDFEKRQDWFVCVLTKYPSHLHAIIGTEEVARINTSTEYKTILGGHKKQGDREKAKSFLQALKQMRTNENTWADLSKKLVTEYDTQLAVLNSQKIGQLSTEAASTAESAAAAAMASLGLGAAVTIHSSATTTTSTAASTSSPAAQLASV